MESFAEIIMALVGPAFIGLVGWLRLVHLKTHNNEIALSKLRTHIAEKYSSKDVENKIFQRIDEMKDALGELRTEVRVAISTWRREDGQTERRD